MSLINASHKTKIFTVQNNHFENTPLRLEEEFLQLVKGDPISIVQETERLAKDSCVQSVWHSSKNSSNPFGYQSS